MKQIFILLQIVVMTMLSAAPTVHENYNQALTFVGDEVFYTQLAKTEAEQRMGLMFRSSIKKDQAMLFINDSPKRVAFWMKNTKIELDMLFFDQKGRLLQIIDHVLPCQEQNCPVYPSKSDQVKMILEIKGGEAKRRKIKVGDMLRGCGF